MAVLVRDLLASLDDAFPFAWAEPWDRVGLLAGDPSASVQRVLVSLDADLSAIHRAAEAGAQVLLTHHPASLESSGCSTPESEALRLGVALIACHTNLDRTPEAVDAAVRACGLLPLEPLEHARQKVASVVTYVPHEQLETVLAAMAEAGAGRIGSYKGCAFVSQGEGRYTPLPGAEPFEGVPEEPQVTPEDRIEAVCPPELVPSVLAAIRRIHPYEEPVVLVGESELDRGSARLGRVCEAPKEARDLAALARVVADELGVVPRVWGPAEKDVKLVAFAGGSGSSLVPAAVAVGADVLVTGELRYHGALDALTSGLAVIEAGHDATEWPMVRVLADAARRLLAEGVLEESPSVRWWTP